MNTFDSLNLTPAESLTLMGNGWTSFENITITTFVDLLMKGVLELHTKKHPTSFKDYDLYVSPGKNFIHLNRLKPHEKLMAESISCNEGDSCQSLSIAGDQFRIKSGCGWFYKVLYIKSPMQTNGYFYRKENKLLSLVLYYSYPLTDKGQQCQSFVKDLINDGISNLGTWMKTEPKKAISFLDLCGGNFLLIKDAYELKDIIAWRSALSNRLFETNRNALSNYRCLYNYYWNYDKSSEGKNRTRFDPIQRPNRDFLSLDCRFLNDFKSFKDFQKIFNNF